VQGGAAGTVHPTWVWGLQLEYTADLARQCAHTERGADVDHM